MVCGKKASRLDLDINRIIVVRYNVTEMADLIVNAKTGGIKECVSSE